MHPTRTRVLQLALGLLLMPAGRCQYLFDYDRQAFIPLTDARAEAMGRANVALPGDLRSLSTNPAGLVELNGVEACFRHAQPYYVFEQSRFTHAAIGCRLTDRLAFGFRYDENVPRSDVLVFSDPLGVPYPYTEQQGVLSGSMAYRVAKGFAVGTSLTHVNLGDQRVAEPHLDISTMKFWPGLRSGPSRNSFRISTALENVNAARVDRTFDLGRGFVFTERYALPVISRTGISWRSELHKGWVHDSLPSLAFTAQAQFEDDLTSRFNTAVRLGGELELLGMLAVRLGWYTVHVDDLDQPQFNKSDLSDMTWGFGMILPLATMFGAKCPISASFDYCSLPQVAFSTDGLSPFTDEPWERFQSWGLRVAYGLGPVFKKKSQGA